MIWSPNGGLTQARFPFPKDSPAVITDAAGAPLEIKKKGDVWTVPLSASPIVISRVSSVPLPVDAAEAADKEAIRLIKVAKEQGLNVDLFQQREFQAKNTIPDTAQNADIRYNMLARLVGSLAAALQPYLWIEGNRHRRIRSIRWFRTRKPPAARICLWTRTVSRPRAASQEAAIQAEWKFQVSAAGTYSLWTSTTPLPDAAPFTYTLDDGGANVAQNAPEGWEVCRTVCVDPDWHDLALARSAQADFECHCPQGQRWPLRAGRRHSLPEPHPVPPQRHGAACD